jgi:hypothetical protein
MHNKSRQFIFGGEAMLKLITTIAMLASLLLPNATFAFNEQLKGKLRMSSFKAQSNPDLPTAYAPPDWFLKNQLNVLLSSSGYQFNNSEIPINIDVEIRRFDWNNLLGTYTVDLVVQYSISFLGTTKTFMTTSSANASFGQITWGADRNNHVMKKVTEDSVNKLQNYLEFFEPPKVDSVEKIKQKISPSPTVNIQTEGVREEVLSPTNQDRNKSDSAKNERLSLEASKKKCTELGFKPVTEGYGKCVLQLSK